MTDAEIERFRAEMPICREWAFLNHCGTSPIPTRTAQAMQQAAEDLCRVGPIGGQHSSQAIARGRQLAAQLVRARPDDIAFVLNTTEAIAYVANGICWRPGDNVVIADIEYPANVYPWWMQERRGAELRWVKSDRGRLAVEDFARAIDRRTRVLAVSFVEFSTGFRNDLPGLGELCAQRGVLLVVDAIQGLGALTLDVDACRIAALACGGHKWLLAPPGAGIFYCRPELLDQIGAANAGAASVLHEVPYLDYALELKPNAGRFESGTMNVIGLVGLAASLELIHEAGVQRIEQRVKRLTDYLCDRLQARGYGVYSSREAGSWSSVVCFECGDRDGAAIAQRLREAKVHISFREGRLRAGPHFYNTEQDIDRLVEGLPG